MIYNDCGDVNRVALYRVKAFSDELREEDTRDILFLIKNYGSVEGGCAGICFRSDTFGSDYSPELNRKSIYESPSKIDKDKLDKILKMSSEEKTKAREKISATFDIKKDIEFAKREEELSRSKERAKVKEKLSSVVKIVKEDLCISESLRKMIRSENIPATMDKIVELLAKDMIIQTKGNCYKVDLNSTKPWEVKRVIPDLENETVVSLINNAINNGYVTKFEGIYARIYVYMDNDSFKRSIPKTLSQLGGQ